MKSSKLVIALLLLSQISYASSPEWKFLPISADVEFFFGKSVLGLIENRKLETSQVVISQAPLPQVVPKDLKAWQALALSSLKSRKYSVLAESLNSSPRTVYSAELAWSMQDIPMRSRIAVIVTAKSLILVTYDRGQADFKDNAEAYRELFRNIATGKLEDILNQAIKLSQTPTPTAVQ